MVNLPDAVLGSEDAVDAVTGATAGRRSRDPATAVVIDEAMLSRSPTGRWPRWNTGGPGGSRRM